MTIHLNMRTGTLLKLTLLLLLPGMNNAQAQRSTPSQKPVFQVDYPYPTADKPQSKLWFREGCWWALLPRAGGPSLWQRRATGWQEHPEVFQSLKGVPGRADVWADADGITAVGVAVDSLVVFRLVNSKTGNTFTTQVLAVLKPATKENIETATIARDSKGAWWVAADGNNAVYVWYSADGKKWSNAINLKAGIDKDDICVVAPLPGAVLVSWSNQREDAVQYRLHTDGDEATNWTNEANIATGNKTADDHLHTALTKDGALWMVSKNSVDSNDFPQLVLRIRQPSGSWLNFPYAPRTASAEPSRPVIIATPQNGLLLEAHTIYDKSSRSKGRIVCSYIDTSAAAILTHTKVIIEPSPDLQTRINDCTVPKEPFPQRGPWIVLASDEKGRVYEADVHL